MKKIDHLILLIGIILIIISSYSSKQKPDSVPSPIPTVPVITPDTIPPKPKVPDLVSNVIHNNNEEALRLSKLHNRPLVIIFGADWCPYCKDLKHDISAIKQLEKCIVSVIDINKNEKLVDQYDIKGLPTSIILINNKEQSRKSGYKKNDYETWLNGNL